MPGHPSARTGSATRPRTREDGRVREGTTAEKKSGSVVCGTEESDRATPLTLTTHEVRAGAVLPGSGCAEHQATGAVPQPADNTWFRSHYLEEMGKEFAATISTPKSP